MTNKNLDDLLKPSLEDRVEVGQPFSATAHFLVGFFGGGIASAVFCIWSARMMGLARQKTLVLTLLLVFSLVITTYLLAMRVNMVVPPFGFSVEDLSGHIRLLNKILGVVVYGGFYLGFKKYISAANMSGLPSPSPWLPGFACAGIGTALLFGIGMILLEISANLI